MATALAISSHVARGHVGLTATVPALQWLGHEVWALPTVVLASRPGLGRLVRHELPPADLGTMLSALEADGCWASLDAVSTGYFASPAAVAIVAGAVHRIRHINPGVLVLVDPILGDGGRLYVTEATAAAIRDQLLPLATVATPNLFELAWLTGASVQTADEIVRASRALGLPTVVVTSALEAPDSISTLLVTAGSHTSRTAARRTGIANGAGDLFAGLLLGHLLRGQSQEAALDASLADLDRVLAVSENQPVLRLSALGVGRQ
jgi:pyridoxine kinase